MKRKIYYHICFLRYESKKGINGILLNKIHTFQRLKILDNFCIHHALNDYDHDVLAQLIDVFDNPQEANEFRKRLKTMTPDEIIAHRENAMDYLRDVGLVKVFNDK